MDDLLDLSWSDSKPASKPVHTAQSANTTRQPTPNPTFDFLSKQPSGSKPNYYAAPSSTPPLRATTPQTAPLPASARFQTPRSTTPNPVSSSDAFSSLLSFSGSGANGSSGKTLSLAERQQLAEKEKLGKAERERAQFTANGSFWDNLGSGSSSTATAANSANSPNGLDELLSPKPMHVARPPSALSKTHPPTPPPQQDVWDDDDTFLSGPSKPVARATASADPFDFDAFNETMNAPASTSAPKPSDKHTSNSFEDDEDDLLGGLGQPAQPGAANGAAKPTARELASRQKNRRSSPPPHIIGQIVEMGFSPMEARSALAQTSTGVDVESALETLLGQSKGGDELDDDQVMRERQRREEEDAERRRRRRAGPSRASVQPRTQEQIRSTTPGEYGDQAEKIMAQATEIGTTFLKGATSFWNSSKEKALKVYEEQKKAREAETRKDIKDGRPRWMVDAEREDEEGRSEGPAGGFKDSDEETPFNAPGPNRETRPKQVEGSIQRQLEADLLGGDGPKTYQPASRRPRPAAPASPPTPVRPPTPLIKRILVDASSTQLQSSASKKAKGNEHFKLGRFSEAESAYTSAISTLPEGHLYLIPLHNNRAATRLKLGESASAVKDCSVVISIIGTSYHPSKEAPLPEEMGKEVKLGDALVKATTKRAQAWEMGEKWPKALEDWERVLGFDAALVGADAGNTKTLASEGVRRAKKMLSGDVSANGNAVPEVAPSRPKPAPRKPAVVSKSVAVSELRKANQAAEAEDAQRTAVKDSVDAKVAAWKGGKETNLRALIASLDTVLWDDVLSGGLRVGMHELITEKQVKIKYMKVIARLHPDKLDTKKTTVEQRMLANAAFSTLNDAWQAFNNA